MRPLRPAIAAVVVAGTLLAGVGPAAASSPALTDWLGTVNAYRSTAALPPVGGNGDWAAGGVAHSRYMVVNGVMSHEEDPAKPGYSEAGHEAGMSGNVMASMRTDLTARHAIDMWMQGPFHAAGLLDPRLRTTAYGQYADASAPSWRSAATMDTIRGIDRSATISSPVVWPGNRSGVPMAAYQGGEWPDPLSPCPGYVAPSGLPVVILGGGTLTSHTLTANGSPVEHCAYDAGGYRNPDAYTQDYARRGMASRGAAFIVPRHPLEVGVDYLVSATVDGRSLRWSFRVTDGSFVPAGAGARPTAPGRRPPASPATAPQPRTVPAELAAACPDSMPEGGFVDLSDRSVHRAAVDCVAWWQVTTGASQGRYAPRRAVTRAQMASFLLRMIRAAGKDLPEGADRFVDDNGSPHERAINTLSSAGVVDGMGVGFYRPETSVTRGQMATMLSRAIALIEGEALPEGRDRFVDDNGSPHETAINRAAHAGLAAGTRPAAFAPGEKVTRDQMATFVSRSLARLAARGFASPPAR